MSPPPGQPGVDLLDAPPKASDGDDGGLFDDGDPGDDGRAGHDFIGSNPVSYLTTNAPAIRIRTFGQQGGNGGGGFFGSERGGTGGDGGMIDYVNTGALTSIGAPALQAQSFGGRGGEGGSTVIAGSASSGGRGGSGGVIRLQNSGTIETFGAGASGISAESIGGRGGNGGDGGFFFGEGGNGVGGSLGGNVSILSTGAIHTRGDRANGIIGVSIGGSGGNGGDGGLIFSAGGSGGSGVDGGRVEIDVSGTLLTEGALARGVMAQSIGGGGGNGGNGFGLISLGGSGNVAGNGGAASITARTGRITTTGATAAGLWAQSIGGGGGSGGNSGGLLSVGGSGGSGGGAGSATITSAIDVTTHGQSSSAIQATSIGGGGGSGGNAIGLISLGGQGSGGGNGGAVGVSSTGVLDTRGDLANGILAQSIGGGGGNGGDSVGLVSLDVRIFLGARDSRGGTGGTVQVASDGTISTAGRHAAGVLAQSIGGGGGAAGDSLGLITIGGSSSAGGNAGQVTLTGTADVLTRGDYSSALVAQSIGGGGGSSGGSVGLITIGGNAAGGGSGGNVTLQSGGDLLTRGLGSTAVLAQSIGGGGGDARGSFGVLAIGGRGGSGGNGGDVSVVRSGLLETVGADSIGILAQSIGGGGGSGGFAGSGGLFASFGIGGRGGNGGEGGDVALTVGQGAILTHGDRSTGASAQSVGGGGGSGGAAFSLSAGLFLDVSVAIGGNGGVAGDGGTVVLSNASAVTTLGLGAYGVRAQSVGGGGGDGGFGIAAAIAVGPTASGSLSVAIGGRGGAAGDGGNVSLANHADIATSGADAAAIFAQSQGGGGGSGGFSIGGSLAVSPWAVPLNLSVGGDGGGGGGAGDVVVDATGRLTTGGDRASAILAQSIGGGGGIGGMSFGGAVAVGTPSVPIGVSIGGAGAGGGNGGRVQVRANNVIVTSGAAAHGINAASVGGGGGSGGLSASLSLGIATMGTTVSSSVAVGGTGAGGGDGGAVDVGFEGAIDTAGIQAIGVRAASIGGGGGDGGLSIAGSFVHGQLAIAPSLSLGGASGLGGDGRAVRLTSAGTVRTAGNNAAGLFAQSIGGGGGTAGMTIAISDSLFTGRSYGLSMALGGSGGAGGDGGAVDVSVSGRVATLGDHASAVIAQSIGGGGGVGSLSFTQSYSAVPEAPGDTPGAGNNSIQLSIGGRGGAGGDSGAVHVLSSASIATSGAFSHGIYGQSIGGGGGIGGASGYSTDGDANIITALLSVGGSGGDGGRGGLVDIRNSGGILATGASANGILAESIGGGGGSGGRTGPNLFVDSATALLATIDNVQQASNVTMTVRIGGSGGDGNVGGDVFVGNTGTIDVGGISARGVFAQSIGGGGGNGGLASAPIMGLTSQYSLDLTVGGFGGTGNHAGAVRVDNGGSIVTRGASSTGVLAQSIGGGGGTGGTATRIFSSYTQEVINRLEWDGEVPTVAGSLQLRASVGGFGGTAGDGGAVNVNNSGSIIGLGINSTGIAASSIGGGGGNGGAIQFNDYAKIVGNRVDPIYKYLDEVQKRLVKIEEDINDGDQDFYNRVNEFFGTSYNAQNPIDIPALRERIVRVRDALDFRRHNLSVGNAENWSLQLGGFGGASGNGGAVTATNSGEIHMAADGSYGIFAQSVGGGGGSLPALYRVSEGLEPPATGGGSGGATTTVVDRLTVYQTGGAPGSQTGGNNQPTPAGYDLALGGFGGAAGDGGAISITNSGNITVDGNESIAIFAQSIGGGGGNAGAPFTRELYGVKFTIRPGGAAGDGGDIHISNTGTIVVNGDNSYGILAQSIGGGGGTAFSVIPGPLFDQLERLRKDAKAQIDRITRDYLGFDLSKIEQAFGDRLADATRAQERIRNMIGRINSALDRVRSTVGLDLGHLELTDTFARFEAITARLTQFDDVLRGGPMQLQAFETELQNRLNALTDSVSHTLFSGRGGDIDITSSGSIIVNGDNSIAYFAQSVGGRGGFTRTQDGTILAGSLFGSGEGGAMAIRQQGDLIAMGRNGIGFFGQSAALDGSAGMTIELDGDVIGGSGAGAGVMLDGSGSNRLTLRGRVGALSGEAIITGDGNDEVTSYGSLIGNIRLGLGANSLSSIGANAVVVSSDAIDLNGGRFASEGLLSLGGRARTDIVNDFSAVQTTLLTGDFVQRPTGHLLADLSFGPHPSDLLQVTGRADLSGTVDVVLLRLEDARPVTLIATHGGATLSGLDVPDTLALDYGARIAGNDVQITLTPRFDAPVDRPNARALGRFLNRTLDVGGASELSPMLVYLGQIQDRATYAAAMDALSPEAYLAPLQLGQLAAEDTITSVSSCTPAGAAATTTSERGCAWIKPRTGTTRRDANADDLGFTDDVDGVSVGMLRNLDGPWSFGFSVGWEEHQARTAMGPATFSGDLYSGAVTLKWERDHGRLALALGGGGGTLTSERQIQIMGPGIVPQVGRAEIPITFLSAGVRASRYFPVGGVGYVRPQLDADLSYVRIGAFQEGGAGAIGAHSSGADNMSFTARPAVEMGLDLPLSARLGIRPWVSVGGAWRVQSDFTLPVAFNGSVPAAGTFDQRMEFEGVTLRLAGGLDLYRTGRFGLRVNYELETGERLRRETGRLAFSLQF